MTLKWIISIISKVLSPLIPLLSIEIKAELEVFIRQLYQKAKKTDNVFDDFFVKFIADILNISVE